MDEDFIEGVHAVVEGVPPGHVIAYSQVAALIGSRSARGVGRVMRYYGSALPWWRVVRSDGVVPAERAARAAAHYDAEGTPYTVTANGLRLGRAAFTD
ncbi:MGMT family protein [Mycetocola reblochoni]|uniref:Methylated-DNA-[protein]-cysteine S-methyltransferase DNA binding domain-containing protein n=2 Tax=Mycetocola reblochoni TaxID=331618 RepID=A0A1R4KB98_9MICO|nr:MGMT family protein [Mycetocola reblochoni]RLP69241.1 hypothetical protein D9V30_07970 [Mycetocola reblochoni]SJN41586.1 hypothetical protein FM119_12730 [Mycetocola reblochoni REB411]